MRIATIRKEKEIPQNVLAEACGIKANTFSQYETGARKVPAELLPTIAKALGCTIDDLFGEEVPHADPDEEEIRAETE